MSKLPKVLMLGWEYPPVFSGGLGVVTKNLAQALVKQGADITLVLPQFITHKIINGGYDSGVKLLTFANNAQQYDDLVDTIHVPTFMYSPYMTPTDYKKALNKYQKGNKSLPKPNTKGAVYGENLWTEIDRFAAEVVALTSENDFHLVHAQDWITAEAALQLKLKRDIPYIIHIHATEVDRTGTTDKNSEVFQREKYAMQQSLRVITVSQYTKKILVDQYDIDPEKIIVVYNAYETKVPTPEYIKARQFPKNKKEFWVLFIGRVTLQKGPEYFVDTAAKVIPHNAQIHFHIAGDGDMMPQIKAQIKKLGLEKNVHCHGFLPPAKRDALYMLADTCIIPSVSEPFGLTAIEVIDHCTPLIISKNCGANEIINHKLEVDFYDTGKMAEYVLALQKYPELRRTLRTKAMDNKDRLTWDAQALRMMEIYKKYTAL